jgi:hypothetical protein
LFFNFKHLQFLQNEGKNNTNIANNSSLPKIIPIVKIHLDISGKVEKSPLGPIVGPNPGPTLDIEVAAPEIEVIKSRPVNESNAANKKNITK